jgi:hypothetical protein
MPMLGLWADEGMYRRFGHLCFGHLCFLCLSFGHLSLGLDHEYLDPGRLFPECPSFDHLSRGHLDLDLDHLVLDHVSHGHLDLDLDHLSLGHRIRVEDDRVVASM